MRIRVLGTRGEIDESAPYHARHTGLLFDGALLVDLGEPEFLAYRPQAVLLTHLHADHAYFVRPGADPLPDGIPIFGPEPCPQTKIRPFGRTATISGHRVRPIPVHHSLRVRSQAYLISRAGRTALFTGDMLWIEKAYHPLIAGVDMVITEASAMRAGGFVRRDKATGRVFGHRSVPDLVRFFAPFCRRILLVHFGSWFYAGAREARRQIASLGRKHGVDVEAAHDGQEIVV